jgi:hypothetical protein
VNDAAFLIGSRKTRLTECPTGLLHCGCTVFAWLMHRYCIIASLDIRPIADGIGDMEISHPKEADSTE